MSASLPLSRARTDDQAAPHEPRGPARQLCPTSVDAQAASVIRPQTGGRQLDDVPVGIMEIEACAAAPPACLADDRDAASGEMGAPFLEAFGRNAQREM